MTHSHQPKQEIAEMLAVPVLNTAALTLFSTLIEKKTLQASFYDGLLLGGSTLLTDVASTLVIDNIADNIGHTAGQISHVIAKPIFNAMLYQYGYDKNICEQYQNIQGYTRDYKKNMVIGGLGGISLHYLKCPLVSFVTNISYL